MLWNSALGLPLAQTGHGFHLRAAHLSHAEYEEGVCSRKDYALCQRNVNQVFGKWGMVRKSGNRFCGTTCDPVKR